VTHQAGQVQTPSISPNGMELVYLSDNGGHGNLWVTGVDGHATRQITFEHDPDSVVGVPVWSPIGRRIAFLITRQGESQLWFVNSDGSGLRPLGAQGFFACWSGDGQWLYYCPTRDRPWHIMKSRVDGGPPVEVLNDALSPAVSSDGTTLYYATQLSPGIGGHGDYEICRTNLGDQSSRVLTRIAASRVPVSQVLIHMFLSPDGSCLAMPLSDGPVCNLWALPTDGSPMRSLTDFGDRSIVIARRIAWSPDGQFLYAGVAETQGDVVSIDGLL
jgi:TolB protein